MKIRKILAIGSATAVAAAVLAGCAPPAPEQGDGEASIRMAMISASTGQGFDFSPGHSDWGSLLARPVYEFLITNQLDDNGALAYGAGVITEWDFNDDFTAITLTVREGTEFSDGSPLDAEAVAANAQYWIDNEIDINWGYFAESVEVVDDTTLTVNLKEAALSVGAPQIEYWMSATPVVSAKALADDPDSLVAAPVGSGPYTLDEDRTTQGVVYSFAKRDDYWNADAYGYDDFIMKLYPDGVAAVNALKGDQVDFAPVDTSTVADVKSGGFDVLQTNGVVRGLMLGDKAGDINPAIADVKVRQAINMAFDRETIAATLEGGYAQPLNQPWPEGYLQHRADDVDTYAYDPEGAKELLAEAGYPDGFDLTLPTYTDQPDLTRYDPMIKQSLEDIGIRVTYETTDWFPAVTDGTWAVTNNYIGPWVVQQYYLAHHGLFNPWDYEDPKMQDMLETYNFGSPEERDAVAPEIGQYTLDQAWMAIFSAPQNLFAMKDDIEVLRNLPLGTAPDLIDLKPAK